MVLPRFIDAALRWTPLIVHDDGQQTRCFAHVADVIYAMTALMDTPAAGRVFNIGSESPITILDLARKVTAAIHPELPIEFQSCEDAYSVNFEDCRARVPSSGQAPIGNPPTSPSTRSTRLSRRSSPGKR